MARSTKTPDSRRMRGFESAGGLVRTPVRKVAETRGFAVTRLLTHWDEVAGPDLAPICRPDRIGYGREGLGATLRLLAPGAAAPLVEMQREALRERINALYGYNAIARITVTQTSQSGLAGSLAGNMANELAEPAAAFAHKPRAEGSNIALPSDKTLERVRRVAQDMAADVGDSSLRDALTDLAASVMARRGPKH